ncbi:CPBP family intramembrane glutamic endopeptidase [Ferruginibacter sp. SUN002]|uniref:CPBP family intramembrane glutamic endopeptidase n=1 Tax=Ferruginibacter sp. SUN002 TaxID=2937789 RepID=UPI003D368CB5
MQSIIKYLREFYNREFNWLYFCIIICMLGGVIYLNYWHGLEKKYITTGKTKLQSFGLYYLLYLVPFAIAFAIQSFFFKEIDHIKNVWFWIMLLLAPAFFSFRVNFDFHKAWMFSKWNGPDRLFYFQSINWIVRVFVVLIPVIIVWFLKDRNNQPFYGIKPLDHLSPYLIMLAIMIPLIALASTQNDFLQTYPKAKILNDLPSNSLADKWRYLIFELSYGFDFVSIEFFFRGFLVLALAQICGTHCIIPIACFYCTIHLGKPMGEAISSFFGGMLLGIISINTGSIWGGLIVHLGIAWMMEIGGWLGWLLKK